MKLSLPEALVLADLDDATGAPLSDAEVFAPLLAAAMIGELELGGRIRYDGHRLRMLPGKPVRLLEPAEHCLGGQFMPIAEALASIAAEELRHTVQSFLVGRGALQVTSRRRLWWRVYSWPTANPVVEDELRDLLRGYVVAASGPLSRTDRLLCLLERADLLTTIWPEPPLEAIRARAKLWPLRAHLRSAVGGTGVRMRDG
jgi:hypothetical protein